MQLYECVVRLNGQMTNEVRKFDVTAAEIFVLKHIHNGAESGVDVVHSIKPTGHVEREDHAERRRLQEEYRIDLTPLFGHAAAPLPQSVPGVDSLPPPKKGKRAKPKPRTSETDDSASETDAQDNDDTSSEDEPEFA